MNINAVVTRIIKQFLRDKRSLALLVVAPILVLTLIWLVLDGNEYEATIAMDHLPEPVEQALLDELNVNVTSMTKTEAMEALESGEIDAYLTFTEQSLNILLEGSKPTTNNQVLKAIQQSVGSRTEVDIQINYYYGSDALSLFDQVGAVLIGFLVFFFVFIIGGISFLRERMSGTLEKLLSTPIKRWELVTGYLLGFGIFTIIQSLIIVLYSVYILDVWMVGDIWQLLIITFLLAMTALTLATLLSAFANNEFQIMQFIPLVIIPQVFFSGLFDLESMAEWIQVLSKFMPLTYGAEAMQDVMIKGKNLLDVWPQLAVIVGFICLFYMLNILALKKHRRL